MLKTLTLLFACTLLVTGFGTTAEFVGDTPKDFNRVKARRNWWAFQPVGHVDVPSPQDAWVRNPIDAFLLEAMRARGVQPSPEVSKGNLLRRVTLDLTGLPPTPEETGQFLRDKSPDAYEHLVDRLLASPAYGERWAQRWLDVVRYADTNGFEVDGERRQAWRYRDYVVRSFNENKPYERFLKEQIAGDEIWPGNKDALVALGFHRAGPEHIVSGNLEGEMTRQENLIEMTAGIGNVFLGMTVNCARCHNHKFDPILQSDYYRLQAVFGGTEGKEIDIATPEEKARYEAAKQAWKARLKPVEDEIAAIEKPYRDKITEEKKQKLEPKLLALIDADKSNLSEADRLLQKDARDQIKASWDEIVGGLSPADRERRTALRNRLHEIGLDEPEAPAAAYAVVDKETPENTNVLKVGDYRMKLGTVTPGIPSVLAATFTTTMPAGSAGRRRALAEWLGEPDHPLTARVMVNRIWQFRMGRGIVGTPNDFGTLGEKPTNQKLLDWLAQEFVSREWSVKAMDRLIVLSSAYRQTSDGNAEAEKIDPDNKLWWRMNRRRLEGEAIRDNVLAASGMLNRQMGGRAVRVPIDKAVYDLIFTEGEPDNLWPMPKDHNQIYRRSLYLLNKRTVRLPMLANFDQPDTMSSCAFRPVSTHALQALDLLNSDFMTEQSAAFAARVTREGGRSRNGEVRRAYALAVARAPSNDEFRMATKFFAKGGTLQEFCLALLNRSEFLYIP